MQSLTFRVQIKRINPLQPNNNALTFHRKMMAAHLHRGGPLKSIKMRRRIVKDRSKFRLRQAVGLIHYFSRL